ncbi:phage adaptor protein [Herbiconiux daphne]|uniref:Uncharacterized protein n=1 Tax=Herbiconiux daphne TaxID=2970914 RepID=A0ABT2HA37_9MICO|nr:hypothetical protein [Herbiconiux daphne]MCS5736828.1 hypothetical protein [Herbiconiux daphne]
MKNWLNRADDITVNTIPYFIDFARIDFQRTVQMPQYEDVVNYNMDATAIAAGTFVKLPQHYFEMKHLFVNNRPYNRVDVDTFNRIKGDNKADKSGGVYSGDEMKATEKKFYFTRIADEIHTIPELVEGDQVEMIYWKEFEPFTLDNDNWQYLQVGPDIMLYLSLRHAAVFLRDNDQAQFWESKAAEAASGLMKRLDLVEWSGSSLVVKEFRE